MNEEKKAEIRRSLESFQQQLEDLKKSNPEGDYEQLELIIKKLGDMLEGVEQKNYLLKTILKGILFFILLYLIYLVSVCMVLGFGFTYLNINDFQRLSYLVPITSLVILIAHRIIEAALNTYKTAYPLFHFVVLNLLFIFVMSFLDTLCFHVFTNIWQSLGALIAVCVFSAIGEFYLSKKFLFL